MSVGVFGSCSVDLFVRAKRLPALGETVLGQGFMKAFGGKGANQAFQCALLGSSTQFIGRVGRSVDGEEIVRNLESIGIGTKYVNRSDDVPNGVALIEVDDSTGENRIIVVPGANAMVNVATDLPELLWSELRCLVLQLEIPIAESLGALRLARDNGVATVLNPSPVPESNEDMKMLHEALPNVSYLVVNEYEAERICSVKVTSPESAALACKKLLEFGVTVATIVTLGPRGCVFQQRGDDSSLHVPAKQVAAIDTTGAGDSFLGAMVHYIGEPGFSLHQAIQRAVFVASISVLAPGCQPSYPNLKRVSEEWNNQ